MPGIKTTSRARRLRVRAFELGVTVTELAERTGYHRVHVSQVLNDRSTSKPVLDAVEAELDRVERETGASTATPS